MATIILAVGMGFEPMEPLSGFAGLANQCNRPLCQPTIILFSVKAN